MMKPAERKGAEEITYAQSHADVLTTAAAGNRPEDHTAPARVGVHVSCQELHRTYQQQPHLRSHEQSSGTPTSPVAKGLW